MFNPEDNFIENYIRFYAGTEPPYIYRRWAALQIIASLLGRNVGVKFGQDIIRSNQYVLLIGESGARKSTAIKNAVKLLRAAEYNHIAANKTSKEQFLADLAIGMDRIDDEDEDDPLMFKGAKNGKMDAKGFDGGMEFLKSLQIGPDGKQTTGDPKECLIAADELNVFLRHGNIEFIDDLTDLWDVEGLYRGRTKTTKSIKIWDPTINILAGTTGSSIAAAFPPAIIGQGFFSRLLIVFSEPSGRKVTQPVTGNDEQWMALVSMAKRIRTEISGIFSITDSAWGVLDKIYHSNTRIEDIRFQSYSNRRLTHLLKLCTICAASSLQQEITPDVVVYANTILHYTEFYMPKGLGEFGKASKSDVTQKILSALESADRPLDPAKDIWPLVHRDLDKPVILSELLMNLVQAGKVNFIAKTGFTIKRKLLDNSIPHCQLQWLVEYSENLV